MYNITKVQYVKDDETGDNQANNYKITHSGGTLVTFVGRNEGTRHSDILDEWITANGESEIKDAD